MKIKAYILHNRAATIQPSAHERDWVEENEALYANLALNSANGQGWNLLCPCAFEAIWNGGADAEDIGIRLDETQADTPDFVQSQLGGGLLTFHTGYQFKTEGETALWVRGPINLPKDGLYPLERMLDTSMLPCTVTIHWRFTRANQTIRFEAGEPFCTIVPYPKDYIETETFESEVVRIADDVEAYEQALQEMVQDPAVQSVFRRLENTGEQVAVPDDIEGSRATQLTDPPPVSCICPTYGRVELLEEAIYSFLQQDYPGQKELIVLNDYNRQTLEFDHPDVRIINLPQRFNSVGEKYKAAVALCSHNLIFVWHDDDIYLPHRLSFSVANFDQNKGFFKADRAWFWNNGQVSGPEQNVFHGGSCWTRDLFVAVRGYPHRDNGYDLEFEQDCREKRAGSISAYRIKPEEIYYIYRWAGTDSYHLSGFGQNGDELNRVVAYIQEQAKWGQVKQGAIKLNPHWKTDYVALVDAFLKNGHVKQEPVEEEIPFPPPFYAIPGPKPMTDEAVEGLFKGDYPARISVILPSANESVLLKRTVDQFEATLPVDSEIIVVDNGSTDGSADFLVDEKREGIHLIRSTEPLGVAGARNCGLAQAQGEVVVFADAHIDLPEYWWQPMIATLNQSNVGVVGPGIGIMGKPLHGVSYGQRIIADPKLRVEWLSQQAEEPYPVPTLGGGFMAMRHDTLKQAGAFDAGMPQWGWEDLELCLRYWLLGYEVWLVPAVVVLHYFRTANPYKVEWGAVTHNLLRVAFLHFNQDRLARVISALKADAKFDKALAYAVDSDVWQQRAALADRRVRDDDWLFEKFKDSCSV